MNTKIWSRKEALYKQYEELLLRIALQEMNEEEYQQLDQWSSPDEDMERFFQNSQDNTLRTIKYGFRMKWLKHTLKLSLPQVARVAAIFLIIIIAGAAVAFASFPAVRIGVLHFLINVTDEYTELNLVEAPNSEIIIPDGWQGAYYPSYIPEGFNLVQKSHLFNRVTYQKASGELFDFTELDDDSYANIDTEGAQMQHTLFNDQPAFLSIKDGRVTIAWSAAEKYFVLSLDGAVDTAIEIAKSLKETR